MNLRELSEYIDTIKDKEKEVCISLKSPYGGDYDLFTQNIEIIENEHDIELIDGDY